MENQRPDDYNPIGHVVGMLMSVMDDLEEVKMTNRVLCTVLAITWVVIALNRVFC